MDLLCLGFVFRDNFYLDFPGFYKGFDGRWVFGAGDGRFVHDMAFWVSQTSSPVMTIGPASSRRMSLSAMGVSKCWAIRRLTGRAPNSGLYVGCSSPAKVVFGTRKVMPTRFRRTARAVSSRWSSATR